MRMPASTWRGDRWRATAAVRTDPTERGVLLRHASLPDGGSTGIVVDPGSGVQAMLVFLGEPRSVDN